MVDFTRAFRLYQNLQNPQALVRCSRELLGKLRILDGDVLTAKVGKHLNKLELEGITKRWEKTVDHFDKLIGEKGECLILY